MPPSNWVRVTVACAPFIITALAAYSVPGCVEGNPPDAVNLFSPDASRPRGEDSMTPDTGSTESPSPDGKITPPIFSTPFDSGIGVADVAGTTDTSPVAPCVPSGPEACDGLDNNCNGKIDEIFICRLGDTTGPLCVTSCGAAGMRMCEAPACDWGACKPFPEKCDDTIDNDCDGRIDCDDPACASTPECGPTSDAGLVGMPDASCIATVHVTYAGPVISGFIRIEGWWKWVGGVRAWAKIAECADTVSGDGKLDCAFAVPCGTSPFEFQIYLPDGRFWGDTSFDSTGGKGSTIGTVALSTSKGSLGVTLVPNPKGAPYYNGRVGSIP